MGGGGGQVTAAVGRIETLDIASSLDLSIDDLRASVTVLLPGVALDDRTLDLSDAWRKCDVAVMIVPNDSSCACGLDVGVVMA